MKILIKNQIVVKTARMSDETRKGINEVIQQSNFEAYDLPGHIVIQATPQSTWDDVDSLYSSIAKIIEFSSIFMDMVKNNGQSGENAENSRLLHQFIYTRQSSAFAPNAETESQLRPQSVFIFVSDKNQSTRNGGDNTNAITIRPEILFKNKYNFCENPTNDELDGFSMNKQSLKGTAYVSIEIVGFSPEKKMVTFSVSVIQSLFLVSHKKLTFTSFSFIRECALPQDAVLGVSKDGYVNLGKEISFQDLANVIADKSGWKRSSIFSRMYDSFEYEVSMALKGLLISYFKEDDGKFAAKDYTPDIEHNLEISVVATNLVTEASNIGYSDPTSDGSEISINGNPFGKNSSRTEEFRRIAHSVGRRPQSNINVIPTKITKPAASIAPKSHEKTKKFTPKRSKYIVISASSGDIGMSPELRMLIELDSEKARFNIHTLIAALALMSCTEKIGEDAVVDAIIQFNRFFDIYNSIAKYPITNPVIRWYDEPISVSKASARINEIAYADTEEELNALISALAIKEYTNARLPSVKELSTDTDIAEETDIGNETDESESTDDSADTISVNEAVIENLTESLAENEVNSENKTADYLPEIEEEPTTESQCNSNQNESSMSE